MTRSTSSRIVRPARAFSMLWTVVCVSALGAGGAQAASLPGQPAPPVRFAALLRGQGNNRNLNARPGPNAGRPGPGGGRPTPNAMSRSGAVSTPHRPDAQQHLSEWMDAHRNLSPQQQQSALEAEPGFHELRPEEQQRMHNQLNRLNSMPPEQRQRTIARTEWMEHLAPQQRQQVRAALAQLGSLSQERSYAVGRAFRSLQAMPPAERQAHLNSPQLRGQFNDQERGTLNSLLNVSPLLPPPNLGVSR